MRKTVRGKPLPNNELPAYFMNANFQEADLSGVDFGGTDLQGADFTTALNLTPEQFKDSVNLEQAKFLPDFREKLGLPPEPPEGSISSNT